MELTIQQILDQAITFQNKGKLLEAERLYRSVLTRHFDNLDANNNLGIILQNFGKLNEAEECYRKVIKLKPDLVGTYINLGITLKKLNRHDEAVESYKKAIEINPDFFEAHYNLGNILKSLGRYNEAVESYKKAIQINPDHINSYFSLGVVYDNLEKNQEAIEKYIKVLEFNPKHTYARDNLIFMLDYVLPNNNIHPIIIANNDLKKINYNFTLEYGIKDSDLAKLFKQSKKIIEKNIGELVLDRAQIYRKNSIDLGCYRHKGIFNEFNIIPKFCFSCFKIQIEPKNVMELFKLHLLFDTLKIPGNNIRKCIIEMRPKVSGTYKGYIYCTSMEEINEILKVITPIVNKIITSKIKIKRGCTEYADIFPDYKITDKKNINFMKYKNDWTKKEQIFDANKTDFIQNKKVSIYGSLSISDFLIMNNWLNYAKEINDFSYKDISEEIFYSNYISKILSEQLELRKKEFLTTSFV